ncbi:hypothetical protein QVD17_02963 [Tagetes erecta]|uniref:DUF7356 domain-containing protein n=1 Tax=Tagetes erecta TaxID=13708 RepID=A0AAD8P9H3_TARER|nr:hypothetical protein QVD17_02963 [Tagetes erecta]
MDKNGSVIGLLLLFMIVLSRSDAFSSRKLAAISDPNGDANQDSQSSPPPPNNKKPDLSSVEASKSKDSPNKTSKNSSNLGLNQDGKELKRQSCKGLPVCSDPDKTMIACIQDFVKGFNNLSLVVQNEKDVDLKVNITFGTSGDNNLPTYEIPAHGTKEINITFSGDKSNKVILSAGNGDCELQIGQALTTPVNNPKSKEPGDSPEKPKDDNNSVESPPKPKEENSPPTDKKGDSPAKPKDDNNTTVESPTKPKEENSPSTDKKGDTPSKSQDVEDPSKSKDVEDPSKSKDDNDPSKSKDIDDPTKSKSKDEDDPSKSKDVDDPTKSKDTGPPSNPTTSVDAPTSQNKFLDQLTVYSKQVTPIYGAYLAFLVALIIGGSWALCALRKRRAGNGVPYQELEMGPTEASTAVDVETAEGWDHEWGDDDWDEGEAIRSPGGGVQAKSISSNGLTTRATKKDSWDADWDD